MYCSLFHIYGLSVAGGRLNSADKRVISPPPSKMVAVP